MVQALKFIPNVRVLPEGFSAPFLEYLSPRSTLAPPHPSPLAARLLNVDGASSVFYGPDFITVIKTSDSEWAHIKPEVFSLITEAVTTGEQIVHTVAHDSAGAAAGQASGEGGDVKYREEDSEAVGMINELLETRIRPAIQEDGGDIEFRGFEDGQVLLKLRGACRTCDSSTVTLKNGIESMMMHYVSLSACLTFCREGSSRANAEEPSGPDRRGQGRQAGARPRRGDCREGVCTIRGEAKTAESNIGVTAMASTEAWRQARWASSQTSAAAVVPKHAVLADAPATWGA